MQGTATDHFRLSRLEIKNKGDAGALGKRAMGKVQHLRVTYLPMCRERPYVPWVLQTKELKTSRVLQESNRNRLFMAEIENDGDKESRQPRERRGVLVAGCITGITVPSANSSWSHGRESAQPNKLTCETTNSGRR